MSICVVHLFANQKQFVMTCVANSNNVNGCVWYKPISFNVYYILFLHQIMLQNDEL